MLIGGGFDFSDKGLKSQNLQFGRKSNVGAFFANVSLYHKRKSRPIVIFWNKLKSLIRNVSSQPLTKLTVCVLLDANCCHQTLAPVTFGNYSSLQDKTSSPHQGSAGALQCSTVSCSAV